MAADPRSGRPFRRVRAYVIARDAGLCHLCGELGADSADHLEPLAHGGSLLDPSNLAAAHLSCNMRRGASPILPLIVRP